MLLLASVLAFLRQRPWLAVVLACTGASVHSTYLLGSAILILAYLFQWRRQEPFALVCYRALLALVLVAPVVIYNLASFAPSSAGEFAQAQAILAHFRIPHHAEPEALV